jgi:hypothetical protein
MHIQEMVVVRFFISIFLQYFTIYAVLSAFEIYVGFIMAFLNSLFAICSYCSMAPLSF